MREGHPLKTFRLMKSEGWAPPENLNRWSLGDFTKVEGTQMEMLNFLWIIWVRYLPLTPNKNDFTYLLS